MALKRINKEIQDFKKDPYYNIYYFMEKKYPDDSFHYNGWLIGTENTPYTNGIFYFDVRFPADYPFKPPVLNFKTKIYHMSISPNGTPCCCNWPELYLEEGWSPALTISKILKLLRERLGNFPETCIRLKPASYLYHENKNKFLEVAREWTKKYALPEKKDIWDDYVKGNLIGVGSFGEVYNAVDKKNENKVAIKIVRIGNNPEEKKLCEKEIETLKLVKNNILIETKMDDINAYFVMQLFDDNLENIFNKRDSGFSCDEIKKILKEINPTFKELQQNKIMHGDLKLNNILI